MTEVTNEQPRVELIHKALSNPARRDILRWLREPESFFDAEKYAQRGLDIAAGVCVDDVRARTELSQSVVSSYLASMQDAGLLRSQRIGKWTYYRRDEAAIAAFVRYVADEL